MVRAPAERGVVERGAEFVLPGHDVLRATAERLGLRLFDKGTTYGNREPRGGPPVPPEALVEGYEAVRRAASSGALRAPDTGSVVDALDALALDPGAQAAIRARIEVSTAFPADDQDAAVLAESGTSVGDYPTWSVAGGNQRIATGLAAGLAAGLHLGVPVTRIAWSRHGVRITAGGRELDAGAVVVAVPAAVMGRIAFDPPLPDETARAIAGVRYGHAAKLFLPLAGPVRPSATLSVPGRYWTFTQLAPDGVPLPVAGAFAGTAAALERLGVAHGPGRWADAVRALRPDLPFAAGAAPVLATWTDDPWATAAYSARSRSSPMHDAALAAPVGPIHFAGEHTAGAWHALMEGALRSGERAAAEVLAASGRGRVGRRATGTTGRGGVA